MLAARYVSAPPELNDFGDGERPLSLLAQEGAAWIYKRPRPLAVARLVNDFEVIPDAQQAVQRVHMPDFDPASTAILDSDPACGLDSISGTPGSAEILDSAPGYWLIRTASESEAILVLAETAYPGWRVKVDGQTAEAITAYTTLKAVCVPPGTHEIVWTYAPTVYQVGGLVTIATLLLVVAAVIMQRRTSV